MNLQWRKPDEYHIASVCGRFTVCRITVDKAPIYIAFRKPYDELASRRLQANASDAERTAAIKEMQAVCEAATGSYKAV